MAAAQPVCLLLAPAVSGCSRPGAVVDKGRLLARPKAVRSTFVSIGKRLASVALVALLPTTSWPSEGMSYMAAYLCDPVPLTDAVIDRCMHVKPDLGAAYPSIRSDWHKRNEAAGAELKRRCEAFSTRRGQADQARFEKRVQRLNAEATAQRVADIDANPESCETTLRDIAAGVADLQKFVDPQK